MDKTYISEFKKDDLMKDSFEQIEISEDERIKILEDQGLEILENEEIETLEDEGIEILAEEEAEILTDEKIETFDTTLDYIEDNDIAETRDDEIIETENILDDNDTNTDDFEAIVETENPEFYESGEFYIQGINEYGYSGTCGPTSVANCLNGLLDTNGFTENDILDIAVENNLCTVDNIDPAANGGTTTNQIKELYENIASQHPEYGINAEVHEYENTLNIEEMANELDEGSILQVAVDSSILWDLPQEYDNNGLFGGYNEVASDHWINVTGVDRVDGKVVGFKVIDSGGGIDYLSADKFDEACFGTQDRKVYDPTCIVVSKH